MTIHERRAARARWLARPLAVDKWGRMIDPATSAPAPDLHARRASQEFRREWQKAVHAEWRKARRRFGPVRRRYAQAPKGREIAQGWYVE